MMTIGIDIGLTGAIARAGSSPAVFDMPTVPDGKGRRIDGRALILLLRQLLPAGEAGVVVIEDIRARPMVNGNARGNTMHSQGSIMRSRGIVEAVADIARIEVKLVQPQTWKRFYGLLKTEKNASLNKARSMFPSVESDLKRVKDHNRAESLLIAHYGQREYA